MLPLTRKSFFLTYSGSYGCTQTLEFGSFLLAHVCRSRTAKEKIPSDALVQQAIQGLVFQGARFSFQGEYTDRMETWNIHRNDVFCAIRDLKCREVDQDKTLRTFSPTDTLVPILWWPHGDTASFQSVPNPPCCVAEWDLLPSKAC